MSLKSIVFIWGMAIFVATKFSSVLFRFFFYFILKKCTQHAVRLRIIFLQRMRTLTQRSRCLRFFLFGVACAWRFFSIFFVLFTRCNSHNQQFDTIELHLSEMFFVSLSFSSITTNTYLAANIFLFQLTMNQIVRLKICDFPVLNRTNWKRENRKIVRKQDFTLFVFHFQFFCLIVYILEKNRLWDKLIQCFTQDIIYANRRMNVSSRQTIGINVSIAHNKLWCLCEVILYLNRFRYFDVFRCCFDTQ